MKLKLSPGVGGLLARPAVRTLAASWRIQTITQNHWAALHQARQPYLLMCWHEALLPLLWRHRHSGIAIVVSQARDGQYLADLAASIGYRLIRGSSNRGAIRALLGAVKELQTGHPVAFTPDGPRGPRRELKPGVIRAAQKAGGIIIPMHAEADRAWRLDTWDRLAVPKPFARVRVTYGTPFRVAPGEAGLARGLQTAREELGDAVRKAQWLEDGATPTG